MKFIKEITPKGLLLPVTAARLAGFNAGDKVEYHTLDGAMLVLKGRMSAPELLAVVQQLTSTSAQLLHHLSEVCGPCERHRRYPPRSDAPPVCPSRRPPP